MTQRRFAAAESEFRAALSLPLPPGTISAQRANMHLHLGSALCAQERFDEGITHLKAALEIDSSLTEAHAILGEAFLSTGRIRDAAASLQRAVTATPDVPPMLSRLAWILATAIDDSVRDGPHAVGLAERAVRLTDSRDVVALDTLAAAYAEVGRFDDASATIQRALAVAQAQGLSQLVPELQQHAALLAARRPIRADGRVVR
jgi:tetratricopeptide (TPR) repeat protein